ncbi:hypothetical protein C9374_004589 [Naegleria lovaniensis]|uniref:Uncharacterized protein n=1 Tax=Naegleria lovaniensis TaxID=51637 RepID=A0AA88KJH9_NAELO|nr:uncharacterized protein C9374_004589 [Naegleria lovaniensis]KAG2383252.1 hypothetical protein C9374_004589 [Naegleria lovaniensis]
MEKVKDWNNIHDKSCEHFSEYIQLVQLLNQQTPSAIIEFEQAFSSNSTLMDLSLTRKLKQTHENLLNSIQDFFSVVTNLKEIVSRMKLTMIHSKEHDRGALLMKGPYHMLNNAIDYIRYAEDYISMFENELDFKSITFQSMHEMESQYVLNTYLIAWKKQSFIDEKKLRYLEMELAMHSKAITNL